MMRLKVDKFFYVFEIVFKKFKYLYLFRIKSGFGLVEIALDEI